MSALAQRELLCIGISPLPAALRCELEAAGWRPFCLVDLQEASRLLRQRLYRIGLLFVEQLTPAQSRQLELLFTADHGCEWVGVFSRGARETPGCIDLIVDYLFDYHTLPVDPPYLLKTLGHAHGRAAMRAAAWRTSASTPAAATKIVGESQAVRLLLRQIRKVAVTDAPVLIGGESGSGKELAAQAVHQFSRRQAGPFIAVNCGAISSTLIQAELFGTVRGAFTGALRDRKGLLEAADGGTIFLDEIADLPLDMQINLLRFLQEQTITPVGASHSIQVDVRVVAAANVDLAQSVEAGRFRQDLYYRLNVVPLHVPPLRERRDDIAALAQLYFTRFTAEGNPRLRGFSSAALEAMHAHSWPGNVRELINRVRRAVVMSESRMITPADLGLQPASSPAPVEALDRIRVDAERMAVQAALTRAQNNVTHAARALGVSRMTLYRMIERHRIALDSAAPVDEPARP